MLVAACLGFASPAYATPPWVETLIKTHQLTQPQAQKLRALAAKMPYVGTGHPESSRHPVTPTQCLDQAKQMNITYQIDTAQATCGAPYMVPVPLSHKVPGNQPPQQGARQLSQQGARQLSQQGARQLSQQGARQLSQQGARQPAQVCIDQFEFPNIPCHYPVVWTKANQAQQLCAAIGKRLCDAHEWEGGCAGAMELDTYDFDSTLHLEETAALRKMRQIRNRNRKRVWAYGNQQNHQICATGSSKSKGCDAALRSGKKVYESCGSNTYPAGFFPQCLSPIGVYDQHGNAAEHMSIPARPHQLLSQGGSGHTEMKGSWFVFSTIDAHPDDCHWRAPYWHGKKLASPKSHANYHLGFRCCKSL